MTRKDFQLIASTIHDAELGDSTKSYIAQAFAEALKKTNPAFNTDRFIEACGTTEPKPAPEHPCENANGCDSGDDVYQDEGGHWHCGFCLNEEHNAAIEAAGVKPLSKRKAV